MAENPENPRPWRIVLYSHDSQGLGHVRRNLALAHALVDRLPRLTGRGVTGLLLTGLDGITKQLPTGFDHVSLPGVAKRSGSYEPRQVDVSMRRLLQVRSQLLTAAITGFGPDLVIVDRHAYGIHGELFEALHQLRADRPHAQIVLGLREVLDDPVAAAAEWQHLGDPADLVSVFDAVWLYGDPTVHDALATGEVPALLRPLVHHTGYLSLERWSDPSPKIHPKPYVLTMVGGGSDGEVLCRAAAQAKVPEGHRHLLVTGPQMPVSTQRAIRRLATPDTDVVETVPDGLTAISESEAIVSMAGYNTVVEVMSTDIPHLLVPREAPRMEQVIRARGLAAIEAVDLISAPALTPQLLADWMATAVTRRVNRDHLRRDGLAVMGRLAAELLTRALTPRPRPLPVDITKESGSHVA